MHKLQRSRARNRSTASLSSSQDPDYGPREPNTSPLKSRKSGLSSMMKPKAEPKGKPRSLNSKYDMMMGMSSSGHRPQAAGREGERKGRLDVYGGLAGLRQRLGIAHDEKPKPTKRMTSRGTSESVAGATVAVPDEPSYQSPSESFYSPQYPEITLPPNSDPFVVRDRESTTPRESYISYQQPHPFHPITTTLEPRSQQENRTPYQQASHPPHPRHQDLRYYHDHSSQHDQASRQGIQPTYESPPVRRMVYQKPSNPYRSSLIPPARTPQDPYLRQPQDYSNFRPQINQTQQTYRLPPPPPPPPQQIYQAPQQIHQPPPQSNIPPPRDESINRDVLTSTLSAMFEFIASSAKKNGTQQFIPQQVQQFIPQTPQAFIPAAQQFGQVQPALTTPQVNHHVHNNFGHENNYTVGQYNIPIAHHSSWVQSQVNPQTSGEVGPSQRVRFHPSPETFSISSTESPLYPAAPSSPTPHLPLLSALRAELELSKDGPLYTSTPQKRRPLTHEYNPLATPTKSALKRTRSHDSLGSGSNDRQEGIPLTLGEVHRAIVGQARTPERILPRVRKIKNVVKRLESLAEDIENDIADVSESEVNVGHRAKRVRERSTPLAELPIELVNNTKQDGNFNQAQPQVVTSNNNNMSSQTRNILPQAPIASRLRSRSLPNQRPNYKEPSLSSSSQVQPQASSPSSSPEPFSQPRKKLTTSTSLIWSTFSPAYQQSILQVINPAPPQLTKGSRHQTVSPPVSIVGSYRDSVDGDGDNEDVNDQENENRNENIQEDIEVFSDEGDDHDMCRPEDETIDESIDDEEMEDVQKRWEDVYGPGSRGRRLSSVVEEDEDSIDTVVVASSSTAAGTNNLSSDKQNGGLQGKGGMEAVEGKGPSAERFGGAGDVGFVIWRDGY